MEKIGLSETLNRIEIIRKILNVHKNGLYPSEISKLSNIKRNSLSNLIYRFFKEKVSITKIGRNKLFKLINKNPSQAELRLINREKALQKAINLREKGFSYSEIIIILKKEFGGAINIKSIVNIKMNKIGLERYNRKFKEDRKKAGLKGGKIHVTTGHIYKAQKLATEAISKKAMLRIPESSKNLTTNKIRLLAHSLFDGYMLDKNYVVGYCNTSKILMNQFIQDMMTVYKLKYGNLIIRKPSGYIVRYFSKAVIKDLKRYLKFKDEYEELTKEIMGIPYNWKVEFLRAFWDDEGMVAFKEHKDRLGYTHVSRYLEAYQKNLELLKQIKVLHEEIGLKTKINRNKIKISTLNNLVFFRDNIGFTPGVVSCKTSSKWYGIEKNKILRMAIKSYGK